MASPQGAAAERHGTSRHDENGPSVGCVTDPIALLQADRAAARDRDDPNANLCVLATVRAGEPQARTLVLRDIEDRLALFFNASSPKAHEIDESESVAVLVYLPSMEVQYRLTCALQAIPSSVVHAAWTLRPPIPKRLDWLYRRFPQGDEIASRERLVELLNEGPTPEAAPPSALGYYLAPRAVERLQLGQPDRIHDRRRYERQHDGWKEAALIP